MKPKRNHEIETRILPDGYVVLFNEKNNWAHTMTPLAAVAWEYCDGETSVEEIVEHVIQSAGSELPHTELREEIVKLIDELKAVDLIAEQ